jgi:hypothetical protein
MPSDHTAPTEEWREGEEHMRCVKEERGGWENVREKEIA